MTIVIAGTFELVTALMKREPALMMPSSSYFLPTMNPVIFCKYKMGVSLNDGQGFRPLMRRHSLHVTQLNELYSLVGLRGKDGIVVCKYADGESFRGGSSLKDSTIGEIPWICAHPVIKLGPYSGLKSLKRDPSTMRHITSMASNGRRMLAGTTPRSSSAHYQVSEHIYTHNKQTRCVIPIG